MALDVLKWLKEDMGFSDQEITDNKLVDAWTPRAEKIEKGILRQQDYSTRMNALQVDLQKQTETLSAAQANLDAEVAEWATLKASGKKLSDKQVADLDTAQADVLRLQQALRKTATDAGLDPDAILKAVDGTLPVLPVVDKTPPIDMSKYVTNERYQALVNMALLVPAQLDRIQREHFDLTGEYLNPEELTAEVQARAADPRNKKSLELRDIWEEKYEIGTKRTAKSKATYDAAITAAEKRGEERALSESALPGGGVMPVGSHAPVFRSERKSVLERPQPGQRMQAAVTALRTGKYRSPVPGAPAANSA